MAEYIGSRISLISKSDIKYVGTLHEINSESHTVALESVKSYGTENRKSPSETIPPSEQVYEYIVFRGSDVKELTIVSPPTGPKENQPPQVPNDPAILGSARPGGPPSQPQQQPPPPQDNQFRGPPPQQFQNQQPYGYPPGPPGPQGGPPGPPGQFQGQGQARFQGPGGPHGFPGAPGAVPAFGGMGYPPPGYGNMPPYGPPPGGFPGRGQFPPGQQMPGGPQGPNGSKQSTPQPPPGQGAQPPQKPVEMSTTPVGQQSQGPPPPVDSKPSAAAATAPAKAPIPKAAKANNNRVAVPLPAQKPAAAQAPQAAGSQPQAISDATQAATAAVAAAMAKLGPGRQPQGAVDNLTQQVNQMRVQGGQQRGRGQSRGGPRGVRRESVQKAVEVPKEDYDFESANAKFSKQDLVKEAIASGSPLGTPTNGDVPDPMASANGHSNGDDVVIPGKEKGYDKKSSFFDNISSDLKDRAEQQQQSHDGQIDGRTIRREERYKNIDTFGQGSVDGGFRGGFRGRGRGRGGFARGGARGGYSNNRGGGFDSTRGSGFRGRGRGGEETLG